MDLATLAGVVLALGGILLGLVIEGGNVGQVIQPTAAMIVFGGTLGSVLIQFPMRGSSERVSTVGKRVPGAG